MNVRAKREENLNFQTDELGGRIFSKTKNQLQVFGDSQVFEEVPSVLTQGPAGSAYNIHFYDVFDVLNKHVSLHAMYIFFYTSTLV